MIFPLLVATGWQMPAQAASDALSCSDAIAITQARRIVTRGNETLADATVSLPDSLPLQWRSQQVRLQYEIDVSACADARSAALSLFRVGAPYTLKVRGQPLASLLSHRWFGRTASPLDPVTAAENVVYNGRIPALLALPLNADKVVVTLLTLPYIPSGLILPTLGPTNALMPLAVRQIDTVVGFTGAAAGVMLVLAMMASLLWLQRRHDLGFLWMTLACLFWSLRALAYFDQTVYLPPLWFEQFNPYNILLTAITLCAATLGNEMRQRRSANVPAAVVDWRRRPRQALLFAFLSATLVLILSILTDHGALLARAYAQSWAAGLSIATIWWVWTGKVRLAERHR
ncbi:MAG: hypothetical protein ABJA49_07255, partial [Betaproteobacteria bacterium]